MGVVQSEGLKTRDLRCTDRFSIYSLNLWHLINKVRPMKYKVFKATVSLYQEMVAVFFIFLFITRMQPATVMASLAS